MSTYITSDEHVGHRNIIEYCSRPFSGTDHMREVLIANHNAVVPDNKNHVVWHLGDMFWNSVTEDEACAYLGRLHGSHALIYGNHDELIERSEKVRSKFFLIVGKNKDSGIHRIHWNYHEITLCHYAMARWNRSHKGAWMLFGHSHGDFTPEGKILDVGVDCHGFRPWTMNEIETEMSRRDYGHVIEKAWPGKELDEETIRFRDGNRKLA